MKWFWRINYLLTLYLVVVLLYFRFIKSTGEYYTDNKCLQVFDTIFTLDGVAVFFSFFIEWVQIPLCVIISIFMKDHRTRLHFFYILFLCFLSLFKFISWFLIVGEVTYKTI